MPGAPRRHRRLPDRLRPRCRARSARSAGGDDERRRPGAREPLRRRAARGARQRRRRRPDARHRRRHDRRPGHLGRGLARRRRRRRGHRRRARRQRRERLLLGPPTRPSRHARPGDGLLLSQQRLHRGASCARHARPGARGHHRLRRAPRQRHRRHRRWRRAHPDGQHLPASALSVQRRGAARHEHGQRAGPALHARRPGTRADRAELDGPRSTSSRRR